MVKRMFDIALSGLGLLFLLPVFCVIGLLVKLDSPGPVFFRQARVGRFGHVFFIYKFRTMSSTSGKGSELTVKNDPRITAIGKTLRYYKLDELPQLLNVFVGEMSLVGPRPEVPRYVEKWDDSIKAILLSVRPGLTDPASIEFRNEGALLEASQDPERKYIHEIAPAKNRLSVRYVETRSLWLDLKIICKTFMTIVR